jgi:outer membrane receptor protein involved in Fe transport
MNQEAWCLEPACSFRDRGPRVCRDHPDGRAFNNIANGTYQLTVSLSGFSQVTRGDLVVGGANVAVPAITLTLGRLGETVVVTASKVESTLVDAPSTMSVVTSATLASTPAQNYGDLLRSVPGVNVIQLSARDVNITNRQATTTLSNSQLVLLDGRSLYLDFFGLVLWDFLPTNLGDIKQIEVIRGPASAVWGANALTGVVNILTKSPREAPGTNVTFNGGFIDRDAGSTAGMGVGGVYGANATVAAAPNAQWSYRVSGGYFNSDAFPRPTGQIQIITDPRNPAATVGGAFYPADRSGPIGTAYQNRGTSQPKFDLRVDQEINGGTITYEGGVAGTQGLSIPVSVPSTSRRVRIGFHQSQLQQGGPQDKFLLQLRGCRSAQPAAPRSFDRPPLQLISRRRPTTSRRGTRCPSAPRRS